MDESDRGHIKFYTDIYPRLRELVANTVRAVSSSLNPSRYEHCFELFGYDFMLDEDLRLLLLEVNSNPCLEIFNLEMGSTLQQLVDDIFVLTVDKAFPPPSGKSYTKEHNFDLVYDPRKERPLEPMHPWDWTDSDKCGSPKTSPPQEPPPRHKYFDMAK